MTDTKRGTKGRTIKEYEKKMSQGVVKSCACKMQSSSPLKTVEYVIKTEQTVWRGGGGVVGQKNIGNWKFRQKQHCRLLNRKV